MNIEKHWPDWRKHIGQEIEETEREIESNPQRDVWDRILRNQRVILKGMFWLLETVTELKGRE